MGKGFLVGCGGGRGSSAASENPIIVESIDKLSALLTSENTGKYIKFTGETGEYTTEDNQTLYLTKNAAYIISDEAESAQYYELPTLVNEGAAADLAQGKELINGSGNVIVGTMPKGDVALALTQEKLITGQSTVYSTDAKYILGILPYQYTGCLVGIDAPNCEFITSYAFSSDRWSPSGSLSTDYSNSAFVPFTISLPKCKHIGASAFSCITKIGNISLPNVEEIDDCAFEHYKGNWAFGDMSHSLYIPKCKKLGNYVFANRSQLSASIECLELENIGISPFSSTRGVKITLDPTKIKYLSFDWHTNMTVSGIDFLNIDLPNCVEFAIGSRRTVNTINLPNCKSMGYDALWYQHCSSISVPQCETIGSRAFWNFNNSSTILSFPKVTFVSDDAFVSCSVSLIYCPQLSDIGSRAFQSCSTSNIVLPSVITRIAYNAFESAYSFLNTLSSYNYAYFLNPETVIYAESGRKAITEWSNSTVKTLPDYMFGWWGSSLNTVRLDAIESLPYQFGIGASIKQLIAPNLKTLNGELRYLTSCDCPNVESIISCNYFGQNLSYINLPKLSGSLRCGNFGGGTSVLSYNLGKITNLGYNGFYNARISLYDIPTLRYLPRGCISNTNLLKLWLPCVTKFDCGTCEGCTNLSIALIRSFSSYNGGSTFSNCQSLMTLIATSPSAFSFYSDFAINTPLRTSQYTGSFGSIYVRASLISAFKQMTGRRASFFNSRFTSLENLPSDIYSTLPMPFDIGSLNYAMTRGSTFSQFCESPFNAEDYYVQNGYVFTSDGLSRVAKDGIPVKATDVAVDYDFIQYELI